MVPQFNHLKFNSDADLNLWLKKETFKIIDLKDNGQDIQKIWVHESGEILYSDFQSTLYCGKFLDMKKVAVGNHLNIWDDEKNRFVIYARLFIESIS